MLNIILSVIFSCVFVLFASGQDAKNSCPEANNILISKDRPTVYTTFEREGEDASNSAADSEAPVQTENYILIRVHNNTRWAITIFAEDYIFLYMDKMYSSQSLCTGNQSVLRDGGEIDAEYYVKAKAGSGSKAPEIDQHTHLSGPVWIAPGNSMLFRVSQKYIYEDWDIVVPFRYEWEMAIHRENRSPDDIVRYEEPRHYVYFHFYQLPETVKKSANIKRYPQ